MKLFEAETLLKKTAEVTPTLHDPPSLARQDHEVQMAQLRETLEAVESDNRRLAEGEQRVRTTLGAQVIGTMC